MTDLFLHESKYPTLFALLLLSIHAALPPFLIKLGCLLTITHDKESKSDLMRHK